MFDESTWRWSVRLTRSLTQINVLGQKLKAVFQMHRLVSAVFAADHPRRAPSVWIGCAQSERERERERETETEREGGGGRAGEGRRWR